MQAEIQFCSADISLWSIELYLRRAHLLVSFRQQQYLLIEAPPISGHDHVIIRYRGLANKTAQIGRIGVGRRKSDAKTKKESKATRARMIMS
jgi:hypothetical protein